MGNSSVQRIWPRVYEEVSGEMKRIVSEANWNVVRRKGREWLLVLYFQPIKMKTGHLV